MQLVNMTPIFTASSLYRMKKFAVVKFPQEKDCVAAVPLSWLSENRAVCHWPSKDAGLDALALAKQEASPGTVEEGWEPFPVDVLGTSSK